MNVVSAPGKAFLIGEYAVLEGAAATVTAVDVRAYAHLPIEGIDPPPPPSPFADAAHRVCDEHIGPLQGPRPIVTTQGFTALGRKLGFGSSAAVVAARAVV